MTGGVIFRGESSVTLTPDQQVCETTGEVVGKRGLLRAPPTHMGFKRPVQL